MSKIKMPIEKSHIMMFARSIGDANPKYYEEKDENVIAPQYFYGTATDDLFSKEIINNYPIPKLITGRIIASNNDEAEFQINKIRNYILNTESGSWRNNLLLLADDEFQNNSSIREEKYHTYFSNEIFNAIEQSRVEAKGSINFKGIKSNITKILY